jgi:hypothetical protein
MQVEYEGGGCGQLPESECPAILTGIHTFKRKLVAWPDKRGEYFS